MNIDNLYQKSLNLEFLNIEEGLFLYDNAPLSELMFIADEIRKNKHKDSKVTWIIDRNVNITNVCISGCKFCNFHRSEKSKEAYITNIDQYKDKINELYNKNGKQLLLQGGHHPKLGLSFYTDLFKKLKELYPDLKLHALGPPEIVHINKLENKTYKYVLEELIESGLDSLPGAGAEILSDRVRKKLSPNKCLTDEWLNVMIEAHKLGLTTSATMMFGHIETREERIQHLIYIRDVQSKKQDKKGFIAFIPWPFQDENTFLKKHFGIENNVSAEEYIRTIAISRIMLPNIDNIQASWLTVGKPTAQICLYAGANDFGSIMIEENVVSAAGSKNSFNAVEIQNAITEAGFIPQLRNQQYDYINI